MSEQDDRIASLARQGQEDPQSLTADEIRELALVVLEDEGLALEPDAAHQNPN